MARLKPWLGDYISSDLRSILDWKRRIQHTTDFRTTRDPNGRLSDDGSNFYSTAKDDGDDMRAVQIVSVFSTDPVLVGLSDGIAFVRATLGNECVRSIEAETDDSFDDQTVGDVISLSDFTLVTTNLGPPEEFVRLDIRQIQYLYHLRKLPKDIVPIEDHETIRRLIIKEYSLLRERQFTLEQVTEAEPVEINDEVAEDMRPTTTTQPDDIVLQSFATQVPQPRKRKGPSLAADGYEVESGVNLERPRGANFGSPNVIPARNREQEKTAQLLQILGKGKGKPQVAPKSPSAQPPRPASPLLAPVQAPQPTSSSPALVQASKKRKAEGLTLGEHSHAEQPLKSPRVDPAASESSASPHAHDERVGQPTHTSVLPVKGLPDDARLDETIPGNKSVPETITRWRAHRIPTNQQKLLNEQSSWLPSLPGHQTAHPNVPVALLRRWNKKATQIKQTHRKASQLHDQSPGHASEKSKGSGHAGSASPPPSSSSSSNSDDEALPWSSSPLPAPHLPPDSTMNSNKCTPPGAGRALPQRTEPENSPATRQSQQSTSQHPSHIVPGSRRHSPRAGSVPARGTPREHQTMSDWTAAEDEILMKRLREGRTPMEIVVHDLRQRTTSAIRNRKRVLLQTYDDDASSPDQSQRRSPVVGTSIVGKIPDGSAPSRTAAPSQTTISPQRNTPWHISTPSQWVRSQNMRPAARPQAFSHLSSPSQASGVASQRHVDDFLRPDRLLDDSSELNVLMSQQQEEFRPQASRTVQGDFVVFEDAGAAASEQTTPHDTPPNRKSTAKMVQTTPTAESIEQLVNKSPEEQIVNAIALTTANQNHDPATEHRLRRREHFAQAKRIHWLRENYVPALGSPLNFGKIYQSFKQAFPHDVIKPSTLSETIDTAFLEHQGRGLRLKNRDSAQSSPSKGASKPTKVAAGPVSNAQKQTRTIGSQEVRAARATGDPPSSSSTKQDQSPIITREASISVIPETVKKVTPRSALWTAESSRPLSSSAWPSPAHAVDSARLGANRHQKSTSTATTTIGGTSRAAEGRSTGSPRSTEGEMRPHFADFAEAFKKLGPGGAFAEFTTQPRREARRPLGVDRWEL